MYLTQYILIFLFLFSCAFYFFSNETVRRRRKRPAKPCPEATTEQDRPVAEIVHEDNHTVELSRKEEADVKPRRGSGSKHGKKNNKRLLFLKRLKIYKRTRKNLSNYRANKNNEFAQLLFVFLIIVAVTRPSTMADYSAYVESFIGTHGERFELSFQIIKFIVGLTGFPVFFGFLAYACLSISIRTHYITKFSPSLWGSIIIYLSYIFIVQDMIAIRAAVASSLLLPIIAYGSEDKKKIQVLLFIVACFFHYSAAIFALVFLVSYEKRYRLLYVVILLIGYLLAIRGLSLTFLLQLIPIPAISTLLNLYISSSSPANIFNLVQLGHIFVCLAMWVFIPKMQRCYPISLVFLKVYTIGLVLLPLFNDLISVAFRFSELFLSVEVLLIPMAAKSILKNRIIQRAAVIVYALIIFYFSITNPQYWNPNIL